MLIWWQSRNFITKSIRIYATERDRQVCVASVILIIVRRQTLCKIWDENIYFRQERHLTNPPTLQSSSKPHTHTTEHHCSRLNVTAAGGLVCVCSLEVDCSVGG